MKGFLKRFFGVLMMTMMALLACAVIFGLLSINQTQELADAAPSATTLPRVTPGAIGADAMQNAAGSFPYAVAQLPQEYYSLQAQNALDERKGGETYRVASFVYADASGQQWTLRSITPSGYLAALTDSGWRMTQAPAATLAGLEAVVLQNGTQVGVYARSGEVLYALEGNAGSAVAQVAASVVLAQ